MRNNDFSKRISGGNSALAPLFEQSEDILIEIGFDTDNDAFSEDNFQHEFNRIIDNVAKRIKEGNWEGKILDINGNTIGSYLVTDNKNTND